MVQRRTICNRDCPDACSIVATVEDGRITKLQGDRDHPVTRGFLCYRTNHFLRAQYDPARLTTPLKRKNGALTPVSWDEALDFAASELMRIRDESGPEAIFHYKSGGTLGMLVHEVSSYFFERFGPCTVKRGDICSGAGEAAQNIDFGKSESNDLHDLRKAKHIILWGKNVFTSSPHTIPVLKQARAAGTEVLLIDPVHHQTANICDLVLQPRPAGDFSLAMAVARTLFDRGWLHADAASWCDGLDDFRALVQSRSLETWCASADVTPEQAEDIARRLHDGPTTILVGWGMARRLNGGSIVRALDALGAITGNVGIPGGGVSYYFQRRNGFASRTRGKDAAPRTIPEPLFGPAVLAADPPIRALWITAGNPAAMLPDAHRVAEAIKTRELSIVVDNWMSDTAALCDLVLPTNTLLEADDLVGAYGHHYIGEATPLVPPPDNVRTDLQIFQALAERVGLGDALAGNARDWKESLISDELAKHVSLDRLAQGAVRNPLAKEILFEGRRFPTASGKAQLISQAPPDPAPADPDYPMMLLSLSTPKSQSSQWAKTPPRPAELTVHPDATHGIPDGATATLRSKLGSMQVRLRHDPRQRTDVAIIPKGGHLRDGSCANAITRAQLTDIGEGGALYDERVCLE
jgi:anaerobic selenocysteine-containing dehydrogenase